jgi:hypothetical protein
MRTRISHLFVLAAVITGAAAADQRPFAPTLPQPRVRLDPVTRTAVSETKLAARKESADPVVEMSPFIVKSSPIPTGEPEQPTQPTGPFSPLSGGWLFRKDRGRVRIEVGAWPYYNIMWKTDRFKSDLKHVGTEFFRISW